MCVAAHSERGGAGGVHGPAGRQGGWGVSSLSVRIETLDMEQSGNVSEFNKGSLAVFFLLFFFCFWDFKW